MALKIVVVAGAVLGWAVFSYVSRLRVNIEKARRTGLPYIVTPIAPTNPFWLLSSKIWTPFLQMLPRSWTEKWLFILMPEWAYRNGYAPFEKLGETFLVAAFDKLSLYTCHAELIHQVTTRRDHFVKPLEAYTILQIFGTNVVTTEGQLWRMHRKVTAASFNEKNAANTFTEAISQSEGLMSKYFPNESATSTETIRTLESDTMQWALNIIGYVGFGLRFLWSHQAVPVDADEKLSKYGGRNLAPGFTLNFVEATSDVLHNLIQLLMVPWPILKRLPFKSSKQAWVGKENWAMYLQEFLRDKIAEVRNGDHEKEGMDIMGQLVRAKYGAGKDGAWLEDSDIIGNAFIMFVAGHETTANGLHFTMVQLANNPAAQRQLQQDVDRLFGNTNPRDWDYEQNVNPMMASHLGACMNETLRTVPAVVEIPKRVSPTSDQVVDIDGTKYTLPARTHVSLVTVATGRNPRNWPTQPSRLTGAATDLDDYIPERWYRKSLGSSADSSSDDQEEDFGGFSGPDTSASLFRPVRGSYIPFSAGARSCLGRRIAQVEMVAALATIFQKYSVELAVDEWASDAEVERMSPQERREVYAQAQKKSRETIKEATSVLTLKLNDGKCVPIRVVKRGHERFVNLIEE